MDLFPTGLDNSLFPAIFIGVLLTFIAVETLGWTFTGLVVPGYLASVALASPRAAILMIVEALVSVAIVRALSDGASRVGVGSRFFGRERFFLTLIVATTVRLLIDRVLTPAIGDAGGPLAALVFEGPGVTAHSIGMVLVPLLAHTLDKSGAFRGLTQISALTAATGAIVLLLARTTNLTLADLSLTFEDVALAIDKNPKAYAVLLCGALLAARANVAFGWDFHGIIVPGLLAVAWFTPGKVVVTLVEAVSTLLLASLIVRLPGLRSLQVEGPRRLVLVFFADAVLKFVSVAFLAPELQALRPSDLYGFGYLLPALLADKIWQRHSFSRVLLPATQVSVGGFLLGNGLVLGLGRLLVWLAPAAAAPGVITLPVPAENAVAVARAYVARDGGRTRLSAAETKAWRAALRGWARGGAPESTLARLAGGDVARAALVGEDGGLVVREVPTRLAALRGLGTIVARGRGQPAVVALPRPLDPALSLVALDVARALDARGVVVNGRPRPPTTELPGLPLHETPYTLAHAAAVAAGDAWIELAVDDAAPAGGILRVDAARWPDGLDAGALRALLPGLDVTWDAGGGHAVLVAPAATWTALAARPCADAATAPRPLPAEPIPAPSFDDDLDVAERLFLGEVVVAPLVEAARTGRPSDAATACRAARALGLEVTTLEDREGGLHLAVLPAGRAAAPVLVRVGAAAAERVVAAPRAPTELYTDRAAWALYDALGARALLVGSRGLAARASSYDAALEAIVRGLPGAPTVLEVRGGTQPDGAVLAWGAVAERPPPWVTPFETALARVGLPATRWDGSAEQACCGDLDNPRRHAFAYLGRAHVAAAYLSAELRERRFARAGVAADVALASDVGLAPREAPLDAALAELLGSAPCSSPGDLLETATLARRWAELRHVADLRAVARRPGIGLVVDRRTREAFLVAARACPNGHGVGIVSLRHPGVAARERSLDAGAPIDDATLADLRHGGLDALIAPSLPRDRAPRSPAP